MLKIRIGGSSLIRPSVIYLVQIAQNDHLAEKKPDSKENLASEEGDEKLFVVLCDGHESYPTTVHYIDRRQGTKIFSKKRDHTENYAFPDGIQGLNYEIVRFFTRSLSNGRIFDL